MPTFIETQFPIAAEMITLKYKELWQVEQVFRDMKSVLETRPVAGRAEMAAII